jgi:small multidrug resistance pump
MVYALLIQAAFDVPEAFLHSFVYLMAAIVSELIGTTSLKYSEGFTKLVPSLITVAGYGVSLYMLSQALDRGMPIGIAYAIWSGLGTAMIVTLGLVLFQESLTLWRVAGITLIIGGVIILNVLGDPSH